jgi:hypothetical protein
MEPLTRAERERIIARHPNAAPGEVEAELDEYERLSSEVFRQDPDRPVAFGIRALGPSRERLAELHRKLFEG